MNLTQIQELGNQWESQKIVKAATSLAQNVTTSNAGKLVGNRMFYDNDYMVSVICHSLCTHLLNLCT